MKFFALSSGLKKGNPSTPPNSPSLETCRRSKRASARSWALLCVFAFASTAFAGTVTITSPIDGSMDNSSVKVNATYSGPATATYMKLWIDHVAGMVEQNTNTFSTAVTLTSGSHLLEVQAADPSTGDIYTSAAQITVATLAVNPPSSSLPPGGMQQFSASDSATSSITWSATGGSISSGGLYTAGSSTGTFTVTAIDSNGNKTSVPMVIAPVHTVTVESPQNDSTVQSPVLVHGTYAGTVVASYMKVWVDDVAISSQDNTNSLTTSLYLANGSHLIQVQAHDPSTGTTYTTSTNITVTSGSGSGTVTVSPASVTLQTGGTQQFTATDSAGLQVHWSATGGTISSSGLYTAGTTTGTFTVTAKDTNNNVGTASVTIQSSTGHTVTIESPANNSTVTSPLHVHATYNGTVTASYMKLWIDHVANVVQQNTNVFDTTITLASGLHLLQVQAHDPSTGQTYTTSCNITVGASAVSSYTTWKNDLSRTGQQPNETVLTPANVNSTHFGVLFSDSVDGYVFAQPLYVSNLSIAGGTHNTVFVATEHDSVYAFDADQSGSALWHVSLIPSGATTVPQSDVGSTISPEIGITGTPVIDTSSGTLYVVSETLESGNEVFRLHAVKLTTGQEESGSPVVITASGWLPKEEVQRSAISLANGSVYIAFGSQGDNLPWQGWLFEYSAASLAQLAVWSTTTSSDDKGGIWMAGAGVSADSNGDLYVMTGNGTWDGIANFSDSFVKLSSNLTVLDYFTPYDEATFNDDDKDVGAGGPLLVPNQSGPYPHEIIGCAKTLAIYVVNRDDMGKFQSGSNSQIIQELDNQLGGGSGHDSDDSCFTTPAFWEQNLYFVGNNDVIKAFSLDASTGKLSSTPIAKGTFEFVFPGAQPVVSSNGATNGIVWAVDYSTSVALHAYNATNVATQLYQSSGLGAGAKWAVPTVVNSKVYVGTASQLVVFGPM